MTLMPVSNCSVLGERSSKAGGSRWIGQRSVACDRPAAVDRVAQQVEDPAQRLLADRHAHRAAGVDDRHAADQAVGRAQRHAADAVAAQVLLDLAGQVDLDALVLGRRPSGRCRCSGRWPSSNSASNVEPITWAIPSWSWSRWPCCGNPSWSDAWDAPRWVDPDPDRRITIGDRRDDADDSPDKDVTELT